MSRRRIRANRIYREVDRALEALRDGDDEDAVLPAERERIEQASPPRRCRLRRPCRSRATRARTGSASAPADTACPASASDLRPHEENDHDDHDHLDEGEARSFISKM